jgi:hypothetical protein
MKFSSNHHNFYPNVYMSVHFGERKWLLSVLSKDMFKPETESFASYQ